MSEGPGLRVVSYNIHGLNDDRDELIDVIHELRPDVLIMQEAPRRLRWRSRCAKLARLTGLVYAGGGLPSLGNLVLTSLRVRVGETSALRYPLTPGRHLRGAVVVRCELSRVPFVVVGSHLATDPAERPGQAQLLRKALADLDAPVILGADLNEPPSGTSWRLLAEGLTDVVPAGSESGSGSEPESGTHTFPAADPRHRLDAILVDPRIGVRGCRVVGSPAARRASDHLPIVADLTLPAAG
jgi:endonuclease/exonuclease/phosphatase family metal-dependent hydrolase